MSDNILNDTSPERANRLDEPERPTIDPTEEIESSPERAPTLRRSSRRKKANVQPFFLNDIDDGSSQAFYTKMNNAFLHTLPWSKPITAADDTSSWRQFSNYIARHIDPEHGTWEDPHPMLLSAKVNNADNPKWHQAVNGPFQDQFNDAMDTELDTLKEQNTWTKVKRESWMNVIKSTWAFKIKRFPSGIVRKFKARFCQPNKSELI